MAVPEIPTVSIIVTQALRRAGRTTPTLTQIDEASAHAIQEVKADIMLVAATHPNLLVTSTTVTAEGQQRYAFPEDYNEPYSIQLLDTHEDWHGDVQSSGVDTITFEPTLNVTGDEIIGKYVLITSGPGVEEYREIVAYNTATKTATLDAIWSSAPTVNSTYMIVMYYQQLYPAGRYIDHDKIYNSTSRGKPVLATPFSQEYLLYPVPDDRHYGLLNRYYMDISKLNEDSNLFLQLLREWRSLWIQGVAVKTMQRFDEDRYQSELELYKTMLIGLGNQTCLVRPMYFMDV